MPLGAFSKHRSRDDRDGGSLIDVAAAIERALSISSADACIAIGQHHSTANVRWACNNVTTNGMTESTSLSIISIIGRRAAAASISLATPEQVDAVVRESEAVCAKQRDAADYMPLVDGCDTPAQWRTSGAEVDLGVFDELAAKLGPVFARARRRAVNTFGYCEQTASMLWLASSAGLRRCHANKTGRIDITASRADFSCSSWAGTTATDLGAVDVDELFERLEERLGWFARRLECPAREYDVLLEPSCTADLALAAYAFMTRRSADEGRSPFSRPGGGARIGEGLFGHVTMYSDPSESGLEVRPFQVALGSGDAASVFDNGLEIPRTEWVRDGVLQTLATPRHYAARIGAERPAAMSTNLVVAGEGASLNEMIANTDRALLVASLWYMRTVNPNTALMTGLTRDGVFLIEDGKIAAAVNNFRWRMSPIAVLAQAVEIGRSERTLAREHDSFLHVKAPPMRIERFEMTAPAEFE